MNDILKLFLSLSFSASVIAVFLFILKPFIKYRFSKVWQYYIWLIVIIRLLMPFSFKVDLFANYKDLNIIPNTSFNNNFEEPVDYEETNYNVQNESNYLYDIKNNIWIVWIAVSIMLLVKKITSYKSFAVYIKSGCFEVKDDSILKIYKDTCEMMKIKKSIKVYKNSLAMSPMLVGIIKPFIVLPEISQKEEELKNIFIHELTHYKRFDIIYKWIVQIAVCLHWFNPLVYFVSNEINKNCELSCDEIIIKKFDAKERHLYGDTLIASLKLKGSYNNSIVSVTLNEDARILKERLEYIMKFKIKSKMVSVFGVFLALMIFSISLFTNGTVVSAKNKTVESISMYSTNSDKDYDSLITKCYEDKNLSYFTILVPKISSDKRLELLNKSYDERMLSFFTILQNYDYNQSDRDRLAEKAYKDRMYSFLAVIVNKISDSKKEELTNLAYKENQISAFSILTNKNTNYNQNLIIEKNFSIYEPYGLKYNKEDDIFLYNGKKVGFFMDKINSKGNYTSFNRLEGEISLRAVRNDKYELIGLEIIDTFNNPITYKTNKTQNEEILNISSKNTYNIAESGSFEIKEKCKVKFDITSSIKDGKANLFLFRDNKEEISLQIEGENKTLYYELEAGVWAYNCSGIFKDGGKLSIKMTKI